MRPCNSLYACIYKSMINSYTVPLVSIIVPFMIIVLFPRTDNGVCRFNEMINVSFASWATESTNSAKVMKCRLVLPGEMFMIFPPVKCASPLPKKCSSSLPNYSTNAVKVSPAVTGINWTEPVIS